MPRRPLHLLCTLAVVASAACRGTPDPAPEVVPTPVRDTVVAMTPAPSHSSAVAIDSSQVHEYRGAYSTGFESSWFEPCDAPVGDNLWWVTLTEEARLQRDSLIKLLPHRPTEGLAVRWRGTVSPRMRAGAGHMGRGSRYILVTRILTVRALGPEGACGVPSTSGD